MHRLVKTLAVASLMIAAAGCGSSKSVFGPGSSTSTTNATVGQIAETLGCTEVNPNVHIDDWANAKVSCHFQGQSLTILTFADSGRLAKWLALGPQDADNSGTVVVGDTWAVALFDASQASAVRAILGGEIRQMR